MTKEIICLHSSADAVSLKSFRANAPNLTIFYVHRRQKRNEIQVKLFPKFTLNNPHFNASN